MTTVLLITGLVVFLTISVLVVRGYRRDVRAIEEAARVIDDLGPLDTRYLPAQRDRR